VLWAEQADKGDIEFPCTIKEMHQVTIDTCGMRQHRDAFSTQPLEALIDEDVQTSANEGASVVVSHDRGP
jgi:hypothetical protein